MDLPAKINERNVFSWSKWDLNPCPHQPETYSRLR